MPATPDAFVLLGKVIDGTGTEPVPAGAVAVIGDRIDWVGSADELPQRWSAEGTEVIDCSDRCILPGLVDAHTHLSFCEAQSEEELGMYTSVEYRSMLSGYHAAKVLKAGVTSGERGRLDLLHLGRTPRCHRGRHRGRTAAVRSRTPDHHPPRSRGSVSVLDPVPAGGAGNPGPQ